MSLPCTLLKSSQTEAVKWSQSSGLLVIKDNGSVDFEDPRDGRVTVFPFLFSKGNFSILIHKLQASDSGTYCCQLSHECQRVALKLSPGYVRSRMNCFLMYVHVLSCYVCGLVRYSIEYLRYSSKTIITDIFNSFKV